jgi:hypothetical protein
MPRAVWTHLNNRPRFQIAFTLVANNQQVLRNLIADTGAGNLRSTVELILEEHDCILFGGISSMSVVLGGAFKGTFPSYNIRAQIPQLGFDRMVRVVGIPSAPFGFDGVASFRFLNRFTYGNFGDPNQFGLEV